MPQKKTENDGCLMFFVKNVIAILLKMNRFSQGSRFSASVSSLTILTFQGQHFCV